MRVIDVPRPCNSITFSRDGRLLAAVIEERGVTIWNVQSWKVKHSLALPTGGGLKGVAFSPDGRSLYTSGGPLRLARWNVATGKREAVIKLRMQDPDYFRLSPDGKTILVVARVEIAVFNSDGTRRDVPIPAHRALIVDLAFSADGKWLVSASSNGFARLFDGKTFLPPPGFANHLHHCGALAYLHKRDVLVSGSRSGELLVWDTKNHKLLRRLEGHRDYVSSISVSPDDTMIASGAGDGTLRIWSSATVKLEREFTGFIGGCTGVAFSPAGKFLWAASSNGGIRRFDLDNWNASRNFLGLGSGIDVLVASPDGAAIAIAGRGGKVKVLDASTAKVIAELDPGHIGPIALAFAPDGSELAISLRDGTLRLYPIQ